MAAPVACVMSSLKALTLAFRGWTYPFHFKLGPWERRWERELLINKKSTTYFAMTFFLLYGSW